jgi:hypothetical protein
MREFINLDYLEYYIYTILDLIDCHENQEKRL